MGIDKPNFVVYNKDNLHESCLEVSPSIDTQLPKDTKPYLLTDKEIKMVELCRECDFGQFIVHIEKGQPKRVEDYKKSILL